MSIRAIIIGTVLSLVGLISFVYGQAADPFTIPFPDYEEIPEHQKIHYQQKHKDSNNVKNVGLSLLFVGGSISCIGLIGKMVNKYTHRS